MMKKIITLLAMGGLLIAFQTAWAGNSAGCGLGSTIFKGKNGIVFNVMAATTNGTSGNQTFGMTTGTLGCSQSDTVLKEKEAEVFVTDNYEFLMNDSVKQSGEYLTVYSDLMGCSGAQPQFASVMQSQFDDVFASENAVDVISSTKLAIAKDPVLKTTCAG